MPVLNGETPLVICEGDDDVALLEWLRGHERITGLQIAQIRGIDPLAEKAQVLIKGIPGAIAPPVVALVLDADTDPHSRREAARNALVRAAPMSRHGVYLFPDDDSAGMLEDLYLSVCRFPALASCARDYALCAGKHYPLPFNGSKAGYDAYRSVVRPRQRGVSHGLSEGDVDQTHSALEPLIRFLHDISS